MNINYVDRHILRENKGITLLTLIITIIVVLILTVATINIISDGVIEKAKKTAESWEETEILEQINLVMASWQMSAMTDKEIIYSDVVNDIVDIFSYPHIKLDGSLEDENAGTNDSYNVTAQKGEYTVKDKTQNKLLQIYYPKFKSEDTIIIIYNGKKYTYKNFTLKSEENMVVEITGQEVKSGENYRVGDWVFQKKDDGTLKIIEYFGTGEVDAEDSSILNLTIPNKINGCTVSSVHLNWSNSMDNVMRAINGTLTISADIDVERLHFYNATKMVLKDNVSSTQWGGLCIAAGGSQITDLILGTGVKLAVVQFPYGQNLQNVYCEDNITLDTGVFDNCNKLTEESINRLLSKANTIGGQWIATFSNCNFESPMNIEIGGNKEVKVNGYIFGNCTNINTITIKEGTKIHCANWNKPIFSLSGEIAELIIEDNCEVSGLFYTSDLTIEKVTIKDNFIAYSPIMCQVVVGDIEIGNNAKISAHTFWEVTQKANKMVIGDNLEYYPDFYRAIPIATLEEIEIGNNAKIEGKLLQNNTTLKKVIIGENAKLKTFYNSGANFGTFSAANSIEEVIIGKGAEIDRYTFANCSQLKTITLYLTDEQKADQSTIPTSWQEVVPNANFIGEYEESIGAYIWEVQYTRSE